MHERLNHSMENRSSFEDMKNGRDDNITVMIYFRHVNVNF